MSCLRGRYDYSLNAPEYVCATWGTYLCHRAQQQQRRPARLKAGSRYQPTIQLRGVRALVLPCSSVCHNFIRRKMEAHPRPPVLYVIPHALPSRQVVGKSTTVSPAAMNNIAYQVISTVRPRKRTSGNCGGKTITTGHSTASGRLQGLLSNKRAYCPSENGKPKK